MFGSGARNISFQDLFARPQQDAPATAPDTAMRRERRASPRRHVLPTSAPNEHVGCVARGDAAIGGRQLLPLRIGQKSSIDFILTGLPQDRVDTKLPPQRQIAQVKREPAHFEGGATAHNVSYHRSHHLSHHESDESSDSYEGLPVPREALRLPSIVPNIFINQQHAFQQHQASTAVESPAEETSSGKRKKKRKARICKEEGCDKYVVDHGLCIRHGGGKRCNVEDCNCRAQNRGLCWKHGGYTICKIEGCTKRAKSRGICWSHGGGTRCKSEGCSKIAVSLGRCWAHGGGKRCSVDGCKKPASERTNNYCADHFGWFQQEGVQDV